MEFDLERAFEEIALSDLVSFDVFDTALLRQVEHPVDIFRAMEFEASGIIGQRVSSFFRGRLEAEAAAKSKAALDRRQISLADIYEELRRVCGLTAEQTETLLQLEIALEQKFTYAHPLVLKLQRHALDLNKTVIFLSDMYLPSTCIGQMLESNGYTAARVYVSAEWGGNKASGKLYQIVQKHLQIPANRCLHFGDNFYADVLRAKLKGWRTISIAGSVKRPDTELVRSNPPIQDGSISRSIAIGLTRKNATLRAYAKDSGDSPTSFWGAFGYEVLGPIYFNYLHWLCRQAHSDKVRRLFLCARDGFPLVRGLEILKKAWNLPLEATYFFASRRLINLAAVRELNSGTRDFLLMVNPGLTLRDFVLRLDLDPAAQEATLLGLGFESLDQRITHDYFGRFLKPVYKAWLDQWLTKIQSELLAQLANNRLLLEDYFSATGVDGSDAAFVDIGWKATVAQAVHDLLRQKNPNFSLRGYFFGTFAGAKRLIDSGGRIESFFMHLGAPTHRQKMISVHEGLIELFFAAPHGSVVGLKKGSAGIEPVFGECEYSPEQAVALEEMREGAYRFIAEAAHLLPDYLACSPSDEYVDRCLNQLLLHPTRKQARRLGRMPYRVSYGDSDVPRLFAAPLENGAFPPQLHAYGRAPWKHGFLAQVSPQQKWLLQDAFILSGIYASLNSGTFWKSLKWFLFRK